ncbi:hypothetical protein EVAR_51501_1 [Eumeta japonica]|uniref:Uncharacterized protein n=1 Tax=Eumeta variegata TaxID=151549 RepID=A0A4C1XBZ5_EUMVA|nr:hypothetical protein EVAR_51501_1 [Eumeta japonica]
MHHCVTRQFTCTQQEEEEQKQKEEEAELYEHSLDGEWMMGDWSRYSRTLATSIPWKYCILAFACSSARVDRGGIDACLRHAITCNCKPPHTAQCPWAVYLADQRAMTSLRTRRTSRCAQHPSDVPIFIIFAGERRSSSRRPRRAAGGTGAGGGAAAVKPSVKPRPYARDRTRRTS